jgi:peptide deformylase
MAILPIYTYDAAVLREKTRDLERADDATVKLVLDMFETLHAATGVGLAANQVGRGASIFIVDVSDVEGYAGTTPLVAINPVIEDLWDGKIEMEEGCLSVPGLRDDVVRPERVALRYRDLAFEEQEFEADGFFARVIQHEYDHLQGVFFTDRLRGLKKTFAMPALNKIKRGEVDADYPIAPWNEMYGKKRAT